VRRQVQGFPEPQEEAQDDGGEVEEDYDFDEDGEEDEDGEGGQFYMR
jgi:hypothetical protein